MKETQERLFFCEKFLQTPKSCEGVDAEEEIISEFRIFHFAKFSHNIPVLELLHRHKRLEVRTDGRMDVSRQNS